MIARPVVTALVLCLLASASAWSKTPAKSPAKASAKKSYTAKTSLQSKAKARSSWRSTKYSRQTASPAAPASERIRSVQNALIERGYLAGEATGVWNAASVEAWKKLEAERKMKVDGKLDSKLLIELGLGPKYDANLRLPVPSSSGVVVSADDEKLDGALPRSN